MLGEGGGTSMRKGITVEMSSADRAHLQAIVADRNSRQKHVWRARIVLLTADGVGTNSIMRQTGKSKVTMALAGAFRGARGRRAVARQDPTSAHPGVVCCAARADGGEDAERSAG